MVLDNFPPGILGVVRPLQIQVPYSKQKCSRHFQSRMNLVIFFPHRGLTVASLTAWNTSEKEAFHLGTDHCNRPAMVVLISQGGQGSSWHLLLTSMLSLEITNPQFEELQNRGPKMLPSRLSTESHWREREVKLNLYRNLWNSRFIPYYVNWQNSCAKFFLNVSLRDSVVQ